MGSTGTALTPAELQDLPRPRNGRHYELSDGELIVVGNAFAKHVRVKRRILRKLFAYEERYSTGEVFAESQFTLGEATARIPDAAFLRNLKVGLLPDGNVPIPFAPDLAIEVISDSESADDAEQKVAEYLAAGTQEVWQVYPQQRRVRVRTTSAIRDYTGTEVITSPVLPGFEAPIDGFFSN